MSISICLKLSRTTQQIRLLWSLKYLPSLFCSISVVQMSTRRKTFLLHLDSNLFLSVLSVFLSSFSMCFGCLFHLIKFLPLAWPFCQRFIFTEDRPCALKLFSRHNKILATTNFSAHFLQLEHIFSFVSMPMCTGASGPLQGSICGPNSSRRVCHPAIPMNPFFWIQFIFWWFPNPYKSRILDPYKFISHIQFQFYPIFVSKSRHLVSIRTASGPKVPFTSAGSSASSAVFVKPMTQPPARAT